MAKKNTFGELMSKFTEECIRIYGCDKITLSLLKSKSRKREVVDLRHLIISISYIKNKNTKPQRVISEYFNRDHSTVVHAISKIKNLIENDSVIKENYTKMCDLADIIFKYESLTRKDIFETILKTAFECENCRNYWSERYKKAY